MARKNYRSKSARKLSRAELPIVLPSFLADVEAEYDVTVTNGSGVQHVTLNGTKSSVWEWAQEAGRRGGFGPGHWYPIGITVASNVVSDSPFLAVS